ncbi:hypothetical protein [Ensifer adhaerens]|uniref:hypothetical protein n=1 Tax=Ensifer adhaerens TaxID=106592 RepID=UPI00117737D2
MSFANRIALAKRNTIISDDEFNHLTLVRSIRNAFGHEHDVSLANEPQKSQCEKLYADVIGDGATYPLRRQFSSACAEIMGNLLPRLNSSF